MHQRPVLLEVSINLKLSRMSLGDGAERIFWETPELREKLYSYLDLGSLVHLTEGHKLTRESLDAGR